MKADHPSTVAAVPTVAQAALSPLRYCGLLPTGCATAVGPKRCCSAALCISALVFGYLRSKGVLACYRAERLKGNASAGVAACAGLRWSMNASIHARVEWALIPIAHAVHVCTALHCTAHNAPHCRRNPAAYGIDRSLQHTLHLLLRFSSDPFICAAIVDVFGALASRRSCFQATECSLL